MCQHMNISKRNLCSPTQGSSAETSGGLLICLPREQAAAYCKDIEKQEGSYLVVVVSLVSSSS